MSIIKFNAFFIFSGRKGIVKKEKMKHTKRIILSKTLQTIAYISIPDSADLEFLLWDLQDAIAAYAQLSGTALPRPVDLGVDDAGAVDGIVLAVDDALDDEAMIAVEQILDRFGGTGTRVYAVIRAAQEGAEQARGAAVRPHKACERQRAAPTPTAWYAPSLHCPHRSGTPL